MDIVDLLKNSDKLKEALRRAIRDNNRKLAKILIPLVKDPYLTYLYAFEIIKGKIKDEWEDIIAQDPYPSYYYAKDVLNSPFIKGEDAISKKSELSYMYVQNILKDRFEKGEEAISKSDEYSFYYAKDVLKNRFEKGEETIINDKKVLKEYMKFLKEIGKLDEFLEDHPEVKLED